MAATLHPDLPKDFPHRRLVLETLKGLTGDPIWQAYRTGVLGSDPLRPMMFAAAFRVVAGQAMDHDFGEEAVRQALTIKVALLQRSLIKAFEKAIDIALAD